MSSHTVILKKIVDTQKVSGIELYDQSHTWSASGNSFIVPKNGKFVILGSLKLNDLSNSLIAELHGFNFKIGSKGGGIYTVSGDVLSWEVQ